MAAITSTCVSLSLTPDVMAVHRTSVVLPYSYVELSSLKMMQNEFLMFIKFMSKRNITFRTRVKKNKGKLHVLVLLWKYHNAVQPMKYILFKISGC